MPNRILLELSGSFGSAVPALEMWWLIQCLHFGLRFAEPAVGDAVAHEKTIFVGTRMEDGYLLRLGGGAD